MVNDAMAVEHEIQKQVLERLKLDWPPGEPFYAVVEAEIARLRTILGGMADLPSWAEEMGELQTKLEQAEVEITRLREELVRVGESRRAIRETAAAAMEGSEKEIRRLRRFLEAIEAGFGKRRSAAEMASEARAALDGALEPQP